MKKPGSRRMTQQLPVKCSGPFLQGNMAAAPSVTPFNFPSVSSSFLTDRNCQISPQLVQCLEWLSVTEVPLMCQALQLSRDERDKLASSFSSFVMREKDWNSLAESLSVFSLSSLGQYSSLSVLRDKKKRYYFNRLIIVNFQEL